MNTALKLGGFLAGLAVVFGVAFLTGTQAQTLIAPVEMHQESLAQGLSPTQDGYTLTLHTAAAKPGQTQLSFSLTDPAGQPVTNFTEMDGSDVHLVAIRRDLTLLSRPNAGNSARGVEKNALSDAFGYQHVTPSGDSGTWGAELALKAGAWRVLVTFQPAALSEEITLGADLQVSGEVQTPTPPAFSRTAVVGDYSVALTGEFTIGAESDLLAKVSRAGQPIVDLEPMPDNFVHAVAIRTSDLGFIHLHGDGASAPGPNLPIGGTAPSVDDYVLFIEFRHDGATQVATFAVKAQQ